MSNNCIRCVVKQRSRIDLLCDDCGDIKDLKSKVVSLELNLDTATSRIEDLLKENAELEISIENGHDFCLARINDSIELRKQLTTLKTIAVGLAQSVKWFDGSIAEHNKHHPHIPACGYNFTASKEVISKALTAYEQFLKDNP